jgi:GntR family transcriptional regulator, transcriptional repressor for pyruvate dehydrogenase complex
MSRQNKQQQSTREAGSRRGASVRIAEGIQRRIQAASLEPGDRLGTEEELAREFGVSRPTLREALRILTSGNLVHASKGPGGGIFVANTPADGMGRSVSDSIAMMLELNNITIEELLEARRVLEPPLAALAAERATPEEIAFMEETVDAAEANLDDNAVLRASDRNLHTAIAEAAGNPVLRAVTEWAFEVLQPRLKELIAGVVDEELIVQQHWAMVRAIGRRDPAQAEGATSAHLDYVQDCVAAQARRGRDSRRDSAVR